MSPILVGLALLAVSGGEVQIDTDMPRPDCPPVGVVAADLAARRDLTETMIKGGATLFYGNPGPSRVGFRTLVVEIRSKRGEVRLTRRVEIEERGCASADEAIVLIVERYFRSLGWTETGGPPISGAPPAGVPSVARGLERPHWNLVLAGGVGFRHDDTDRLQPLLGVDLRHASGIDLFLDSFLLAAHRREFIGSTGTVSSSTWSATIGAGPALLRTGFVRASLLPAVLVGFEHAEASGGVYQPVDGWRLSAAVGGRLAVSFAIGRGVEISLGAAGFRSLPAAQFKIASSEVQPLPAWHTFVSFKLGYAFGP